MCLSCAIPVRGVAVGAECLAKVVEDVPPPPPPQPIPDRGNRPVVAGFAIVALLSILPWSKFGVATGMWGAWTLHWSLLAVAAGALGLGTAVVLRRRPLDPRVEAGLYAGLAAAVIMGAILHWAHPPPLSRATAIPWRACVAAASLVLFGAGAKAAAVVRAARSA
jgi:hypothetical protein